MRNSRQCVENKLTMLSLFSPLSTIKKKMRKWEHVFQTTKVLSSRHFSKLSQSNQTQQQTTTKMAETIDSSSQQCPPLPSSKFSKQHVDPTLHNSSLTESDIRQRRWEREIRKEGRRRRGVRMMRMVMVNNGGANFQIEVRDLYTTNILVS